MSTRYNNGSHYENHQRAAELEDIAGHAHRAAGEHGQEEHLTAHEQSRQAEEYVHGAHEQNHGMHSFGHKEIAALAEELWRARGCPEGSPDTDWFQATKELRQRALAQLAK
jgi:hypothetical protein